MSNFNFNISLSVLNHLGRNLYRNFITVLGEAISNAWDADAKNVWITIDKYNNNMIVKDDGTGMTDDDFQNKFLKIGYSKRKNKNFNSPLGRPFIGRKGIGKLALLSCAQQIQIVTKCKNTKVTGGLIDNGELDEAIKDVALDTGKAAVLSYSTTFTGSIIKGAMQNSQNTMLQNVSKTSLPSMLVTTTLEVGKTFKRWYSKTGT